VSILLKDGEYRLNSLLKENAGRFALVETFYGLDLGNKKR
jgi:hypothetical protein